MDSSLLKEKPAQHPTCTQQDPVPNANAATVDVNEKKKKQHLSRSAPEFHPNSPSNNLALFFLWEKAP